MLIQPHSAEIGLVLGKESELNVKMGLRAWQLPFEDSRIYSTRLKQRVHMHSRSGYGISLPNAIFSLVLGNSTTFGPSG